MSSPSTLPSAALQASKAALAAAIAENQKELGEIQEVDMQAQEEQIKTVFNDPKNFNVKHPLLSPWTLWFDSPSAKGRNLPPTPMSSFPQTPLPQTPGGLAAAAMGWMEDIKRIISFDSVEEFAGLYNNIVPPSQLPPKANYYLFKEGIIPAWEDEANKDGGKWSIQLPKDKNREVIDKMWLYLLIDTIGGELDTIEDPNSPKPDTPSAPDPLITGVIVSTRPQFYRLSIWTRSVPTGSGTPDDDRLRKRIEAMGRRFKTKVLGYDLSKKLAGPLATEVEFMSHKDSGEKKSKNQSGPKKIIV
ncbi:eukaryotic translation initiation factor 4E class I [Abortiporus biennis]|nr:eukaryotic translation initiation factor 4E class I [Abortiporus biennis]